MDNLERMYLVYATGKIGPFVANEILWDAEDDATVIEALYCGHIVRELVSGCRCVLEGANKFRLIPDNYVSPRVEHETITLAPMHEKQRYELYLNKVIDGCWSIKQEVEPGSGYIKCREIARIRRHPDGRVVLSLGSVLSLYRTGVGDTSLETKIEDSGVLLRIASLFEEFQHGNLGTEENPVGREFPYEDEDSCWD